MPETPPQSEQEITPGPWLVDERGWLRPPDPEAIGGWVIHAGDYVVAIVHSEADAHAIVAGLVERDRLRDQVRDACNHGSSDGIDQTPLDDPSKVWKCLGCGWEHRVVPDPERPGAVRLVSATQDRGDDS